MNWHNKLVTAVLSSAIFSGFAFADSYKIDEGHSRLEFRVRHLGISTVTGNFKKFEGTGTFDPKSGQASAINVQIEANSIDTDEVDRDKHLRSADFFDVEKFAKLNFVSKKVEMSDGHPSKIQGEITIKGVTKPLTLTVTDWGGAATDPWGNERIAFAAEGVLDRTEFGLSWNKPLAKAAGLMVGNEIKLRIEAEGLKVK
jgi:polyisoprenoid-binding protein YceI